MDATKIEKKKLYIVTSHIVYYSNLVETAKEAELEFKIFIRDNPLAIGNTWPLGVTELKEGEAK